MTATSRRTVLIVLSGAADPPGAQTPLAEAETPALDSLARRGRVGMAALGAHSPWDGFTALLGLGQAAPPLAWADAVASGIRVPDGSAVHRADFVTVRDGRVADPFAGGVGDPEAAVLLAAVAEAARAAGMDVDLVRLQGSRNLVVLPGPAAFCPSPWELVGTRPQSVLPMDGPERALHDLAGRVLSAHDVNSVRVDLGENPANALWIHGGGEARPAAAVRAAWGGGPGTVIVGRGGATLGLAELLGCRAAVVGGDDDEVAAAALTATRESDLVVVRSASVLADAVDGDPVRKRDAISRADARLVAPLLGALEEQESFRLVVTSDCVIDTVSRRLVRRPVPFVVLGSDDQAESGDAGFDEETADHGGLRLTPDEFVRLLHSESS